MSDLNEMTKRFSRENLALKAEFTDQLKFHERKADDLNFNQRKFDRTVQEIKDKTELLASSSTVNK